MKKCILSVTHTGAKKIYVLKKIHFRTFPQLLGNTPSSNQEKKQTHVDASYETDIVPGQSSF